MVDPVEPWPEPPAAIDPPEPPVPKPHDVIAQAVAKLATRAWKEAVTAGHPAVERLEGDVCNQQEPVRKPKSNARPPGGNGTTPGPGSLGELNAPPGVTPTTSRPSYRDPAPTPEETRLRDFEKRLGDLEAIDRRWRQLLALATGAAIVLVILEVFGG